jgi:uncharacterized protein (DUF2236 family)
MGAPDIAGEAILIAGGGRAILLQLADPAIGHGVADHSNFDSRPLDRLHATLTFAYATVFGTPEQVAEVRARVNNAHGPVHSAGLAGSPAYDAFSPELQLWVAATLYDSAMSVYELVYGSLDDATADLIYAEYGQLGMNLQMPEGLWPPDRDAFADYWNGRLSSLRTDRTTRSVAQRMLHPRSAPLPLRLAMPLGRLVSVGLLPAAVREAYGIPWSAANQRRYTRVWALTRAIYPLLPDALRHWPRRHYLRRLDVHRLDGHT